MEANSSYPIEFAYSTGKKVFFRYLTEADARGDWHHWFNSPDVMENLSDQVWTNPPENQLNYLETTRSSRDRLIVGVCDIKTGDLIGVGGLSKIDPVNRRAEMSIVIGSKKHRNGSYALDSMKLLTEIGLARLNLHKLTATALVTSTAGIEMTKLLGYKVCGTWKHHAFQNGCWVDCILMEIFQSDWLTSGRR